MILRVLRFLSTLTVGIAAGLLVVSLPWPRVELEIGGRAFETLHLEEAFTSLIAAVLIRILLTERSVRALGAMRDQAGAWIYVLVGLNVLLLPQTLGQGLSYLVEDIPLLLAPQEEPWISVNSAPREVIETCLEHVAPDERILVLGSGVRDFQGYLLAYYLHPRALFMVPSDENRMYFAYRAGSPDPDEAMHPLEDLDPLTDAEYRMFIHEHGIEWVLEVGVHRYPIAPGSTFAKPPSPFFADWHALVERGRRGQATALRLFRLIPAEEAFR
jgi:hypothetical protein